MKRIIISVLCVLLVASSLAFGFDLTAGSMGLYNAVQKWYVFRTGNTLSPDTVAYISLSISYASHRFNVPADLIAGIIAENSSFDPNAKLEDCMGLMLISQGTAKTMISIWNLPQGNIYEIWYNILYGTAYLRYLGDLYSNLKGTDKWEEAIIRHYFNINSDLSLKYYNKVEQDITLMELW